MSIKDACYEEQITDFEAKVLDFLWLWKVATTMTIRECFAETHNYWRVYHRIKRMEKNGLVELRYGGKKPRFATWHLAPKGVAIVTEDMADFEDNDFSSHSIYHDALVVGFHLGRWIYGMPENVELFTEQEIKCNYISSFPSWVPKTKLHRCDGFTKIQNGNRNTILAIEVEINDKNITDYEVLSDFYDNRDSVSYVLWLVRNHSLQMKIQEAFKTRHLKRPESHLFFHLEDFKKNGWQCKIQGGQKTGMTLTELYGQLGAKTPGNPKVIRRQSEELLTFLNPAKSPMDSTVKTQVKKLSLR